MKTINTIQTYLKFNCIYCGQHMECNPRFSGRQILCPACLHRIVIPIPRNGGPVGAKAIAPQTWDTHIPLPAVEIPTRYRRHMALNSVLAHSA